MRLRDRGGVVGMKVSETWQRNYQVSLSFVSQLFFHKQDSVSDPGSRIVRGGGGGGKKHEL